MNQKSKFIALATAVASVIAGATAQAQNPNYAPGDIVLFFHQFGGSNTVMLNVGSATTFRDTEVNLINIANINAELSNGALGFGATWYDSSTLWWGAAGVRSNSTSLTSVTGGDVTGRTLYVSGERTSVGTEGVLASAGWTVDSNTSMTAGANGIIAMANRMETTSLTTTLVEGTGSSNIDNQNPFNILGTPTNSFSVFPGAVVGDFGPGAFGSFGGVAAEAALDLYRILPATPGGVVDPGTIREGQFQGTFVIDQAGGVSFIVNNIPEPSSAMLLGVASLIGGCIRRRKSAA